MSRMEADHIQQNMRGQIIPPTFPDFITSNAAQNNSSARKGSYKSEKKRRYRLKNIIAKKNRIGPNDRYKVCHVL